MLTSRRGPRDGAGRRALGAVLMVIAGACARPQVEPADRPIDLARFIPELRGMVLIPAGDVVLEFPLRDRVGDERSIPFGGFEPSTPVVSLPTHVNPFFLDRFEVTNRQYLDFLEESGYEPENPNVLFRWKDGRPAPDELDMPVVAVGFEDARAFARFYGKRLPTTAEWALATRGETNRPYPWGRSFNRNRLNCLETRIGRAWKVGTFESGKSPQGCYDLVGNVWEWTATRWQGETHHLVVGGSYLRAMAPDKGMRTIERWKPAEISSEIGFRCARDVDSGIYGRYLDLLRSPRRRVRLRALEDLVEVDPARAVNAVASVQRRDPDPYVRVVAARRLLDLERPSLVDVSILVETASPGHAIEHRMKAVSVLNQLLAGTDPGMLRGASDPLYRILEGIPNESGEPGRDPGVVLLGKGRVERVDLYREVARRLIELGEPRTYGLLVREAALGEEERYRVAAAEALGHYRGLRDFDGSELAASLARIVRRGESNAVRRAAYESLQGLDVDDAVPELIDMLQDEESSAALRVRAAESLTGMEGYETELAARAVASLDGAYPFLAAALENFDPATRFGAARALAYYLDFIEIPRWVRQAWRDEKARLPFAPHFARPWFEVALEAYGIGADNVEALEKGTGPAPGTLPWPYYQRARAESVLLEERLARGEWESARADDARKGILGYLRRSHARGFRDVDRYLGDRAFRAFRGDLGRDGEASEQHGIFMAFLREPEPDRPDRP